MWNNRVVRTKDGDVSTGYSYGIHEVYYDKINPQIPRSCTLNPTAPFAESFEELQNVMKMYNEAMKRPILDMEYFDSLEREAVAKDSAINNRMKD